MKCPDCDEEVDELWNHNHPDLNDPKQVLGNHIKSALEMVNEMNLSGIISGDHFSGWCVVLFKGDKKKCDKIVEFIQNVGD